MSFVRGLFVSSYNNLRTFEPPENSKVHKLFEPTPVVARDVETKCGRTRVFWVRENIKHDKPLVLLHGWGAGSGCFFKNIEKMACDRPVMLIDVPGFGESERIVFNESNPEDDWIETIKNVIDAELGSDSTYWLGGHSFGAYLAGLLALQGDNRMVGVILMDAWGFAEMTETFDEKLAKLPWYGRGIYHLFFKGSKKTGLDTMRAFPPSVALPLLKRIRKDLTRTYGHFFIDYTFEINSQTPATGEIAFASLGKGFGFAKDPLEPRFLQNLDRLPENVHFIYGGKSWVSSHSGKVIADALDFSSLKKRTTVSIIDNATHHLMCTNPEEFSETVNKILLSN